MKIVIIIICVRMYFLLHLVNSQSCNIEKNVEIQGNDYYHVLGPKIECCKLCYDAYYCRGYTWTNHNGGTCWLKYALSPVVNGSKVETGIVNGNTCQQQTNADITSEDLKQVCCNQKESDCCDTCSQTLGCNAYVWNSNNNGTCALKSTTGPIVQKPGYNMGTLCIGGGCSGTQISRDEYRLLY